MDSPTSTGASLLPQYDGTVQNLLLLIQETARGVSVPAQSPIALDFKKLVELSDRLHAAVRSALTGWPITHTSPGEAAYRQLRHDLRGLAGQIVERASYLLEDMRSDLSDDTADALQALQSLTWKVIAEVNTIGSAHGPAGPDLSSTVPPAISRFRAQDQVPGRILLADDSADNREFVGRLLSRHAHHSVTSVADGEEALVALAEGSFDLIILDVMMPRLDGFGTLYRIRQNPDWRHIPVVMMTAFGEEETVIRGITAGADDYVRRPFNPSLLLARVTACLERKRLRDREVEQGREINRLFLALFPPEVADTLREHGGLKPQIHDRVGVLFLDLVGFTQFCNANKEHPGLVVELLQDLIERLESATERHGVQKIKTIGDAFMATAGLTRPDPRPIDTLVRCARDMLHQLADCPGGCRVRIGIHIGPVLAGVIGKTRFQYDVWGDTVNLSSRLQSAAPENGITLSSAAWEAMTEKAPAIFRMIDVKGLGEVAVWDLIV